MRDRWPTLLLVALIVMLQYPLWFNKGGWFRVRDAEVKLQTQRERNEQLETRNAALDSEVRNLKQGYDAVEDRARFELGLVKQGEVFVQLREGASVDLRQNANAVIQNSTSNSPGRLSSTLPSNDSNTVAKPTLATPTKQP